MAQQAGRHADAQAAYAEAVRLWAGADGELATLRDARARRDALASAAAPPAVGW